MTSHELARELLKGPDVPIFVPTVQEGDEWFNPPTIRLGYFRVHEASGEAQYKYHEPFLGAVQGIAL